MNRSVLGWGLFFILLGAIPLAVRQGLLTEQDVARAWTLWPLLLIAAGIGLLLRRTSLEFLGGLLTAATLGIIGGGLLASGGIPFGSCGEENGTATMPVQRGTFGGTATVELQFNCGELTVGSAAGSEWTVAVVSTTSPGAEVDGSPTSLDVRSPNRGPFGFGGAREVWEVTLPADPTIDLESTVNAGQAHLRFADLHVGGVDLTVNAGQPVIDLASVAAIGSFDLHLNAGEARIALPNLAMRATIEANASKVTICTPSGAGLRVRMNDNITASHNLAERGLAEVSDNIWETADFATAGIQLEVQAQVNAGSLDLGAAGACGA